MKKYLLWGALGLLVANNASALSADEQVRAMRELFVKEFQKMDDNHDGLVSKQEYLAHQFEAFRANIIEADGFNSLKKEVNVKDVIKEAEEQKEAKSETKEKVEVELGGISQALKDMAEFDMDFGEIPEIDDELLEEGGSSAVPLSKEDVMPDMDFVAQDSDSIKNLLEDMQQTMKEQTHEKWEDLKPEVQVELMLNSIRKTLPKKVDDITSWVDVEFADNVVTYVYQADMDLNEFSDEEKKILQDSIKNESCVQAYKDMCEKVKPMFIDQGINMKIQYLDKAKQEINSCELNKENCQ